MALKKKSIKEAPAELGVSEDSNKVDETPEKEPVITQDEKDAVKKAEADKEAKGADTQRLRLATNVVSNKFNLDPSFRVCKFNDKGKVVGLTLENSEFVVDVTIKDSERQGMSEWD